MICCETGGSSSEAVEELGFDERWSLFLFLVYMSKKLEQNTHIWINARRARVLANNRKIFLLERSRGIAGKCLRVIDGPFIQPLFYGFYALKHFLRNLHLTRHPLFQWLSDKKYLKYHCTNVNSKGLGQTGMDPLNLSQFEIDAQFVVVEDGWSFHMGLEDIVREDYWRSALTSIFTYARSSNECRILDEIALSHRLSRTRRGPNFGRPKPIHRILDSILYLFRFLCISSRPIYQEIPQDSKEVR